MSNPQTLPGTARQSTAKYRSGDLQRQYIYLPESVWSALQVLARSTNTSISKLIETFALGGTENSKGRHDSNGTFQRPES